MAALLAGCVTPEEIGEAERMERLGTDLGTMYADQEPITGPISLSEAIARGLKYNLDKRLKIMELGLTRAGLRYKSTAMLPELAASAGFNERDSFRGSSSRSLITGKQSLEVSTSEDRSLRTSDLQVVWNVLDFGLTYLRMRQEADRVMIAEERRIKVTQNICLDIRDAYWRAATAQIMLPRVERLIGRIQAALDRSRGVQSSGAGEPADELALQRRLLEHMRDLMEVRRRLALAQAELASLMNIRPGTKFTLVVPSLRSLRVPHVTARIADLEEAALLDRPELREEDYKKRISLIEVDAALVRLLPGVELRAGTNFDSNSFLFDNSWEGAAALITKNLMELATAPHAIEFAREDVVVADARRQSLSMAVVAQLHIALQRYALAQDVFRVARSIYGVDRDLADLAERSADTTAGSDVEALAALSRKTVSELQYLTAYAEVQNAYGRILNSVGAPRIPADLEAMDIASLTQEVKVLFDEWKPPVASLQVASN